MSWRGPFWRWHHLVSLLLLMSVLTTVTGCWDQVPFPERAPALVITLAPATPAGMFQWTFYFPNPTVTVSSLSQISTSQQTYAVRVDSPTFAAAYSSAQQRLARDLFLGQLEVIILSTKIPASEVATLTNAYNTNGQVPKTAYMVAAQGQLGRLVVVSPQETIPVLYLTRLFDCHRCQPSDLSQFQWQVWDAFESPGISPVMPDVGGPDRVAEIAVYPLKGPPTIWTTKATTGWAYLLSRVHKETVSVREKSGMVAVTRLHDTTQLAVSLVDGRLQVTGAVHAYGGLAQWPPLTTLTANFLHHVEEQVSAHIAADIGQAIVTANQTHEDPFGYGRQWLLAHPTNLALDTPEYWTHVPITIHLTVTTTITVSGVET